LIVDDSVNRQHANKFRSNGVVAVASATPSPKRHKQDNLDSFDFDDDLLDDVDEGKLEWDKDDGVFGVVGVVDVVGVERQKIDFAHRNPSPFRVTYQLIVVVDDAAMPPIMSQRVLHGECDTYRIPRISMYQLEVKLQKSPTYHDESGS
jgi:hypothetical protein